jgi:hypothetical protein
VIIVFPRHYDEEAETAAFVRRLLAEMMPRTEHINKYVQSGYLPSEALLSAQQESFEALALLWAGLPPAHADRMIERLAPRWAEFVALRERTAERARQHIAAHREQGRLNG